MPNNNNYIAFDLDFNTKNEFYLIAQEISSKIENFSPFELDQIHMTVCFLGELNKKIKINKKETFDKLQSEINNFAEIGNLIFNSFELFGSKNNLIVAKFKMSKSDENKIIKFKQYCSKTYGAPDENFYVPHITLGKILHYNETNKIDVSKLNISKPNINIIYKPKLIFI